MGQNTLRFSPIMRLKMIGRSSCRAVGEPISVTFVVDLRMTGIQKRSQKAVSASGLRYFSKCVGVERRG